VDDWSPDLVAIEAKAKEDCSVLLCVIDAETRALVSVLEAVEHVCRARNVVVVVKNIVPPTDFEGDGSDCLPNELKDLERLRSYLLDVAVRHGVDIYSDLETALVDIQAILQPAQLERDRDRTNRTSFDFDSSPSREALAQQPSLVGQRLRPRLEYQGGDSPAMAHRVLAGGAPAAAHRPPLPPPAAAQIE
jgi:hypothetical protein